MAKKSLYGKDIKKTKAVQHKVKTHHVVSPLKRIGSAPRTIKQIGKKGL